MWKRTTAAAAAALLAAGGLGLAMPAMANAASDPNPADSRFPYESTDPIETGCNIGAYVVTEWDMRNAVYNEVQGLAQLVYSPACGTNWVNVYGFTPGNTYSVDMSNNHNGGGFGAVVDAGDAADTLQTYAPGNTCVTVGWQVRNNTTATTEGSGRSTIC